MALNVSILGQKSVTFFRNFCFDFSNFLKKGIFGKNRQFCDKNVTHLLHFLKKM